MPFSRNLLLLPGPNSGDTSLLFLEKGSICLTCFVLLWQLLMVLSCWKIKENATHFCSRILVGPSHQVIKTHILGHRHVAELERKYLPSRWSIWKRHKDDAVKATWTHQSLLDGKKTPSVWFTFIFHKRTQRRLSSRGFHIKTHHHHHHFFVSLRSSTYFVQDHFGVTKILSAHYGSDLWPPPRLLVEVEVEGLKRPLLLHWSSAFLKRTMNQMPKMQTVKSKFSTFSSQHGDNVDVIW